MQTHNDLLISLNGYYYSPEYDDFALRSLAGQSDHNFSVLFIDPYTLEERKNKINNFISGLTNGVLLNKTACSGNREKTLEVPGLEQQLTNIQLAVNSFYLYDNIIFIRRQ